MLKILMGPNVKILIGQSFGSWTHGHGAKALAHEYFDIWAHKYF